MKIEKYEDKNFIYVSRQEALNLINSLSSQLMHNDSNIGRLESYDDKGDYATIIVLPKNFKTTKEHTKWVKNGSPIL
jgi:hypothetical protein